MLTKEQREEIRARCEAMRKLPIIDAELTYLYAYLTDIPVLLDAVDELETAPRRRNDKRVAILADSRDRWKSRAKAFERARLEENVCMMCKYEHGDICLYSETGKEQRRREKWCGHWRFDEARFAGKEEDL